MENQNNQNDDNVIHYDPQTGEQIIGKKATKKELKIIIIVAIIGALIVAGYFGAKFVNTLIERGTILSNGWQTVSSFNQSEGRLLGRTKDGKIKLIGYTKNLFGVDNLSFKDKKNVSGFYYWSNYHLSGKYYTYYSECTGDIEYIKYIKDDDFIEVGTIEPTENCSYIIKYSGGKIDTAIYKTGKFCQEFYSDSSSGQTYNTCAGNIVGFQRFPSE